MADAAFLDAAERGLGRGDDHAVDGHHPGFQRVGDVHRPMGGRGEGVGRQAVGQAVRPLDHLVERLEADDGRQRPEGLQLHHLGVVGHVGEHRGLEKEALVALPRAAASHLRPVVARVGDEVLHGIDPARIGHGPHPGGVVQPVAELQGPGYLHELLDEAVVHGVVHVEPAGGYAHLARVAVLGGGGDPGHRLHVHVVEDHHRRMPAELHGHLLHALGRQLGQVLAHRDRAGERDLADHRRPNQVFGHVGGDAEDHVHHALGYARLLAQPNDGDGRARRFLGRLDDHRAARGEGGGDLATGHQGGEVPRRERRHRADGLVNRHHARAVETRRDDTAVRALAFLGRPFVAVGGDLDLGQRFGQRLALFEGHDPGDAVGAGADQLADALEDPGPLQRFHGAPGPEPPIRGVQRPVQVRRRSVGQDPQHLLRRRIDDVFGVPGAALAPFSVDIKG